MSHTLYYILVYHGHIMHSQCKAPVPQPGYIIRRGLGIAVTKVN